MKQCKTFYNPIYKADGSGELIEVGNTVRAVLNDGSMKLVVVTEVTKGGRRVCWELTSDGIPRSEDVNGVDGLHQKTCADYNYHDGPEDSGVFDPVVSVDS